jgi:hypothetical protein
VLRSWSMSWAPGEEGFLRDSAMYSVIAPEWHLVRNRLVARLASQLPAGKNAPCSRGRTARAQEDAGRPRRLPSSALRPPGRSAQRDERLQMRVLPGWRGLAG